METRHKKAVALQYDDAAQQAPKVVAKGSGSIAETIIAKAKEYDVPLFANKELVESLLTLDLQSEIPPKLYEATVEVFAWLMRQEKRLTR